VIVITPIELKLRGMKQSNNRVETQRLIPIKYHLCKLSVKSVNGAHKKRQMLADSPNAMLMLLLQQKIPDELKEMVMLLL
jgi:hypothetical protein